MDNADVVKYLIDVGAQIDAKNNFGQTPLHCSVNVEVAKCLIKNGAMIETKDQDGETPLHSAAKDGHLEIVEYLIQQGAQVNIRDNNGQTPFDLADEYKSFETAEYLLKKKRESEFKNPPKNISDFITSLCIICYAPRNGLYALLPCGHASLCEPCCYKLKLEKHSKCPSCRKPMKDYQKIFFQEPE